MSVSARRDLQGPTVNATPVSLFFRERKIVACCLEREIGAGVLRARCGVCSTVTVPFIIFMHFTLILCTETSPFDCLFFQARRVIASPVKITASAWKTRMAISIVFARPPIRGDCARRHRICKTALRIFAGITERAAYRP